MNSIDRIHDIFSSLFLTEPLYQLVALTHKVVEDKKVETIAIGKKEMHVNPEFVDELTDTELRLVLFNELDRILLRHPYERRRKNGTALFNASNLTLAEHGRDLGQYTVESLYNFIQDKGYTEDQSKFVKMYEKLASLSDEELMRRTGFTREKLNKTIDRIKLPELSEMRKRHMEYYYNLLDKYLEPAGGLTIMVEGDDEDHGKSGDQGGENGGQNGEGEQPSGGISRGEPVNGKGKGKGKKSDDESDGSDNGSGDGEGEENGKGKGKGRHGLDRYNNPSDPSSLSKEWDEDPLAENEIENIIREAQITGQWGNVSGNFKETLIASLKPKVNYKSILRQFRQSILSSDTAINRMRPSRRFGFGFPGRKHEYTTKLAFFIDTSGSVSSRSLADCIGTVNNIFKYGIREVDVYYFDHTLQNRVPVKLKKAEHKVSVAGRGGTSFQVVFDFLAEKDAPHYDGIIIFTDGECYKPDLKGVSRNDVCWLIDTENHYEACKRTLTDIGRVAYVESADAA